MDMNNINIEEIVKQVLSGMTGNAPAAAPAAQAPAAGGANPENRQSSNADSIGTLRH